MTWTRRRKRILGASVAVAVLLAGAGFARAMTARRVLEALRSAIRDRYGVEARADDLSLSLLRGTAAFEGFRIVDGPVTVFEASRIEVEGRLLDALGRRFDGARVTVLRPVVRVVVEADGRTNLRRILATPRKPRPEGDPGAVVILREGTFEDGTVEVTDSRKDLSLPVRVTTRRLRGTITEWQFTGAAATMSAGDFRADGEIDQPGFPARVSVAAWCSPPGGPPTRTLRAVVTGFDLRGIPAYVGAAERTALGGDFLHLTVDVRSRDGALGPGAVVGEVAGTGTLLPMRVGGTIVEPVFEAESPLGLLLRVPLGRVGRVGGVALDAGWSVIRGGVGAAADVGGGVVDAGVSLGTGLAGAGGAVIAGDPLGALLATGEGLLGVFTSLGGGIADGAASLFGGGAGAVEAISGADAAEIERRFAQRHAARRLAMLRAALASAAGDGAAARHGRIAAEIGKPPAGF